MTRRTKACRQWPSEGLWPRTAPFGLDVTRARSRNALSTSSFTSTTFSSTVKQALHPQGSCTDLELRQFLNRSSAHRRRTTAVTNEVEYDALHFCISPVPIIAPQGYDKIILRNTFHHDLLFAVQKQNRAEAELRNNGFVINYAVTDAHLLVILDYLRKDSKTIHGSEGLGGSYDVYHDLNDREGITTQYYHAPSQALPQPDSDTTEHLLPDYERLQERYQRPYFVRRVECLSVIKAWESLTKDEYMMWHVRTLQDNKPVWVTAFFYDKVEADGQLGFDMEIHYQELPLTSDSHGVCEGSARGLWREDEGAQMVTEGPMMPSQAGPHIT